MESTTLGFFNFMYLYVLLCVEDRVDGNAENWMVIYVHNCPDLEIMRVISLLYLLWYGTPYHTKKLF